MYKKRRKKDDYSTMVPVHRHNSEFNPANHDQGVLSMRGRFLKTGEIPKCFFLKVTDSIDGLKTGVLNILQGWL